MVGAFGTCVFWKNVGWARYPEDLLQRIVIELFVVALAEELYFRGYMQERVATYLHFKKFSPRVIL